MELDLSSYFATSLGLVLLLLVVKIIMYKTTILLKFGITGLYVFAILILIRGYLPFDFYKINLTTSYYSYKILPFMREIIYRKINVGGKIVTVKQVMIMIFAAGWMWITCKKLFGYFAFNRFLNTAPPCHNVGIKQICENIFYTIFPREKEYNIKIVQSNIVGSPAIFVSSNPFIILLDISYTEEELKFVFYHELIHLKHRDFFIKIAADLLIPAYWWNLFIYKRSFDIINQVQELYVDYEVNRTLTKKGRVVYLKVLSKTAEYVYNNKISRKHVYALTDSQQLNLRQRLECIINSKEKGLMFRGIIFSIVLFILSFTFIFEPSFRPTYDEMGNEVFEGNEELSYYIWDGTIYRLYIGGECVYTTSKIHEDFKNLPVYREE